jgi:hypothetical protein
MTSYGTRCFYQLTGTGYCAPHGGRSTVRSFNGRYLCSLDERTTFIPHSPLRLEADWYISPGIHTVLDVHRFFASRSHGSVIVSLCSCLCRACLCYCRQGQTSRHHHAQLYTDRRVRSIHTLRKCGILQSIVNKKLGLWRCVHSLLSPFKHDLR